MANIVNAITKYNQSVLLNNKLKMAAIAAVIADTRANQKMIFGFDENILLVAILYHRLIECEIQAVLG